MPQTDLRVTVHPVAEKLPPAFQNFLREEMKRKGFFADCWFPPAIHGYGFGSVKVPSCEVDAAMAAIRAIGEEFFPEEVNIKVGTTETDDDE